MHLPVAEQAVIHMNFSLLSEGCGTSSCDRSNKKPYEKGGYHFERRMFVTGHQNLPDFGVWEKEVNQEIISFQLGYHMGRNFGGESTKERKGTICSLFDLYPPLNLIKKGLVCPCLGL